MLLNPSEIDNQSEGESHLMRQSLKNEIIEEDGMDNIF